MKKQIPLKVIAMNTVETTPTQLVPVKKKIPLKIANCVETMEKYLNSTNSKSESEYAIGQTIHPINKMDRGAYNYKLVAPIGKISDPQFQPYFTPREMLTLGVFEGKYLNDCISEFPREWFVDALKTGRLSPDHPNIDCNYFKIKSRMSLQHWQTKGWIPIIAGDPDNRGWFQWYCRYYLGRRIPDLDQKQISRWKAFKRHYGQVAKNCTDLNCRPKQRQALLQWSYDAFVVAK
jgi:hypothetical protein